LNWGGSRRRRHLDADLEFRIFFIGDHLHGLDEQFGVGVAAAKGRQLEEN
jgi:hypothetical protein